jgi:hypothetical protein
MSIEFKAIVPPEGAIEKQAWEATKKQTTDVLQKKLRSVQCPEHHQRPRVTVSGSLKKPHIEITGCCQQLIDLATEALQ